MNDLRHLVRKSGVFVDSSGTERACLVVGAMNGVLQINYMGINDVLIQNAVIAPEDFRADQVPRNNQKEVTCSRDEWETLRNLALMIRHSRQNVGNQLRDHAALCESILHKHCPIS